MGNVTLPGEPRLVACETADGFELHGLWIDAANSSQAGAASDAAIVLPGVGGNFYASRLCHRIAGHLYARGHSVLLANTRGHDVVYDEEERSTSRARLDAAMRDAMRARFRDEMPAVAAHFKTPLHTLQRLQYLIYEPGDFFKLHMDGSSHPEADESLRRRKISMILFVNGQATEPCEGCFCGGSLIFYDLLKGPAWKGKGFPIDAEPGLLMAFPADLLHEVAPVTAGIRFTVVGWAE